jgi:hypothetical protein
VTPSSRSLVWASMAVFTCFLLLFILAIPMAMSQVLWLLKFLGYRF